MKFVWLTLVHSFLTAIYSLNTGVLIPLSQVQNEVIREEVDVGEGVVISRLAPSIWQHVSTIETQQYGRISANGLLVRAGQEAVLIDTPWDDRQTRRLFDWVEENWNVQISTVVPTHHHDDCMGGLGEARNRGAITFALVRTQSIAREKGLPVPQNGFEEERKLEFSDKTVILRYHGPGHTEDNIVVWIPQVKVLFGGCLVKSLSARTMGNISEADLERWPDTIKSILETYPDVEWVVPGHGRPGDDRCLTHTLKMIQSYFEETE